MTQTILTIPQFIEAKDKRDLVKLMLLVQKKLNMKLHFFDIQYVNGKWVAWYELDIKPQILQGSTDVI